MISLYPNMLLKFPDNEKTLRILWVNRLENKVVTFDVDDEYALPTWQSYEDVLAALTNKEAVVLSTDPYLPNIHKYESRLSEEQKIQRYKERDANYASIQDLLENHLLELFNSSSRGALLRKCQENTHVKRDTLMDRLRRHWRAGGSKDAQLLRYDVCGNPGVAKPFNGRKKGRRSALEIVEGERIGIQIDPETAQKIARAYKIHHLKSGLSEDAAHIKFLVSEYAEDLRPSNGYWLPVLPDESGRTLPDLNQFRYWGKKGNDPEVRLMEAAGERLYNSTLRPKLYTMHSEIDRPGAVFQIDATIADVYLRSYRYPDEIIGRPVQYFVIDGFSKMIVGFWVGLEGPSWIGAMQALMSVAQNKVELCKQNGLAIEEWQWPCCYLPRRIIGDRGEMLSGNAMNLVNGLGITKSITPPFRPDWKGLIERFFKIANERFIHRLPGAVLDRTIRSGRDYRYDALLNIHQYRRLILECILYHNNVALLKDYLLDNEMIAAGVERYPLELWNWGEKYRSGALQYKPYEYVRNRLLPAEDGSIHADGCLHFKGLWYSSTHPAVLKRMALAAEGKHVIKVKVAFEFLVNMVYLRLDDVQEPIPISLRDDYKVYENCTFEEVQDERFRNSVEEQRNLTNTYQAKADYAAKTDQIIDEARQATPKSKLSKAAQLRGIRENRQDERRALRGAASAPSSTKPATEVQETPVEEPLEHSAYDFSSLILDQRGEALDDPQD